MTFDSDAYIAGDDDTGTPVLIVASTVTTRPPEPLWPGRLYYGKAALIEGAPGVSKTTLALDVIARATRGGPMPDSSERFPSVAAIVMSGEDDHADTLVPRLKLAGADLSKVSFLAGKVAPDGTRNDDIAFPGDLRTLREAIANTSARIVLVDPLFSFIATATDTNTDHKIRRTLGPVHRFAAESGVCVMAIRHHRKAAGADPVLAGGGSIGISAAARLLLLVAKDPDDEGAVLLASSKSNISAQPPTLRYRLVTGELPEHPGTPWTRLVWEGTSDRTAADILAVQMEQHGVPGGRVSVEDWLRELLADGPIAARAVRQEAEDAGFAWRTIHHAKDRLGIRTSKSGGRFGGDPSWYWTLPAPLKVPKPPEDATSTEGHLQHLQAELAPSGGEVVAFPGTERLAEPPAKVATAPPSDDEVDV